MGNEKQGYRNVFRTTGLFGGVQVVLILFSIIKTKIVALWLGTTGFGIISIFNSTTTLISSITNLGLQTSTVRDIASANGDSSTIEERVSVTNVLALASSLLGCVITICLAPILSQWFFKSSEYTIAFVLLSTVILFTGLYNQCYAILQGTRKFSFMAISSILGAFIGLVVSVPLYYYLRTTGIVWSLVLSAIATFLIGFLYVKKSMVAYHKVSIHEALRKGLPTIKLGIYIALSNNLAYLVQFLLKAFLSKVANVETVGLFQAGWSLNTMYVGMIFTAMAKDYYPRLCQNAKDNSAVKTEMNEQAEIGLLLLAPMVTAMLLFIKPVIILLYSQEFIEITRMTELLLYGTLIQVASWSLGYVYLAKNEGRLYFFNEVGTKVIMLPTYFVGYYLGRLEGLGYAFILNQIVYILWVGFIAKKKYQVTYTKQSMSIFCIIISLAAAYIVIEKVFIEATILQYIIAICLIIYSLYQLNKRLSLFSLLQTLIKRIRANKR